MVKGCPAAWNDSLVSGYAVSYNKTLQFEIKHCSSFGMLWVFFLFMSLQNQTSRFQPGGEIRKG